MLATVRNRRALVTAVEEFAGGDGNVSRLVSVEYMDPQSPSEDEILWEHEHGADLVEPKHLPRVEQDASMPVRDFEAVQRAARWLALSPYVGVDGLPEAASPIASPLFGSIQVEDYQLVPLVRALKMPRVTLGLMDDVGLGKSVEAGLILSELILRRRLRRVLILSPAWLKQQWRDEMKSKFSLTFDIVDRPETHQLRRRLGMDTNPWRTFPRIIASYHYLKQPDVLADFLAVCQGHEGAATLPWDLLIVDEAHNLMPSAAGEDSALAKLLTRISRYFEHRVFLTATPHNGYTQSFTGLLEQLDPVRFTKKDDLTAAERRRSEEIVIRRLKSEINEQDEQAGRTPRFVDRKIEPLHLYTASAESALAAAFENFRLAVRELLRTASRGEQMAGHFAVEVLQKRLLSCPYTFADSWFRFQAGYTKDEAATETEVRAAEKAVKEELDDDAETEGRYAYASRVAGAWLRRYADRLTTYVDGINERLHNLEIASIEGQDHLTSPTDDARVERLLKLVAECLREGKTWSDNERLIIFTEYRTTLDYLERRLRDAFPKEPKGRILVLYGGMRDADREAIKTAFNDPQDDVRILIATDAASEGANLQETARRLLHFDTPWNPSRLDQRNGRLDRHGQARDVFVYHFTSETDADMRFLGKVLKKVDKIRTDLGSMSELFDVAFQRRFREMQDDDLVDQALDKAIESKRKRLKQDVPKTPVTGNDDKRALDWLIHELDFAPDHLRDVLEVALGIRSSGFNFLGPDDRGRFRFPATPERWKSVIDSEVRLPGRGGEMGPMPAVLFDGQKQIEIRSGRAVYRPAKDTVLMHLGHPLVRHALLHLSRARYPGTDEAKASSRWLVRRGQVEQGVDAVILVTIEELAVNELRETVHQWVRTLRFLVRGGKIVEPQGTHVPALQDHPDGLAAAPDLVNQARDVWADVVDDVHRLLREHVYRLEGEVVDRMKRDVAAETTNQKRLFAERRAELQKQLSRELKDLEKEMGKLVDDVSQDDLFTDSDVFKDFNRATQNLEGERDRRERHHVEMREFLNDEEARVLQHLLPRRYALRGEVQAFPVTVEIRFSDSSKGGSR